VANSSSIARFAISLSKCILVSIFMQMSEFSLIGQESISDTDPLLFDFGEPDVINMGDVPSLLEVLCIICAVLQTTLRARSNKYPHSKHPYERHLHTGSCSSTLWPALSPSC
jgi:hypothetical protein